MNYIGYLLRELQASPTGTQRQLAGTLGVSLGKCNALIRDARTAGYLHQEGERYVVTAAGEKFLQRYRVRNAVINVADIDIRFVPFAHHVPKGLMEVKGERLVERLLRQLHEAGIYDITVIVGYMAEKFEYLAAKYGVSILFNPDYTTKSNLACIHLVEEQLGGTYMLATDYYLQDAFFHQCEPDSWIACSQQALVEDGLCLGVDAKRRIRTMQPNGTDILCKRGPVYLTEDFAERLRPILAETYTKPGAMYTRWEAVLEENLGTLPLYANILPEGVVHEFGSFEDLRDFNISYTVSAGDSKLRFIADVLDVGEDSIEGLQWIENNPVNQVFRFTVAGKAYICRIPGEAGGRFNSHRQEAAVYRALQPYAITDNGLYTNLETGMKISEYFPDVKLAPAKDFAGLREPLALLQRLHTCGARVRHGMPVENRIRQYEAICRKAGCILFEDYEAIAAETGRALAVIAASNAPKVLCQMNGVSHDCLRDGQGGMRFAHWEFSGMGHALADVATLGLRCGLAPAQHRTLLEWYLGRPGSLEEERLLFSHAAAGGLLWSIWAEYRTWCGENYVEHAVMMYQQCKQALGELREIGA